MDWLIAFSELTPLAIQFLSQLPNINNMSTTTAYTRFSIEKVVVITPNPQRVVVHLKRNKNRIKASLHDLMLDQVPNHPELRGKMNAQELFALQIAWLE